MSFSVLHIGNMLIKLTWSFVRRKGRAAPSSISYFHGPGKDSFSFKCEGGWVTLSRQRDGSWISGSFQKTPRQILWPRGLTPVSYSREQSLLSAARLTIGLFPWCMMGLFSAICSMMMLFPCCISHEGALLLLHDGGYSPVHDGSYSPVVDRQWRPESEALALVQEDFSAKTNHILSLNPRRNRDVWKEKQSG